MKCITAVEAATWGFLAKIMLQFCPTNFQIICNCSDMRAATVD
jgi:hypothetical protein